MTLLDWLWVGLVVACTETDVHVGAGGSELLVGLAPGRSMRHHDYGRIRQGLYNRIVHICD